MSELSIGSCFQFLEPIHNHMHLAKSTAESTLGPRPCYNHEAFTIWMDIPIRNPAGNQLSGIAEN